MNIRKLIVPGTVVLAAFLGMAGSLALTALQANAETSSAISAAAQTSQDPTNNIQKDPSQGGHVGTNGTKETVLTGDTADKVKAAALAEIPNGTVQRVENDAEGSPYEAHMTKADGTRVTVKVDASFKATSAEPGEIGRRP